MTKPDKAAPMIVFDLGGVLMDWSPYYLYCGKLGLSRQEADQFLTDVDFAEWNKEQDRGRSFAEATAELSARFPQYHHLIRAYDEQYMLMLRGAFQPVVDVLARLKAAGYPLYVLSNWSAEKFYQVRPQFPYLDWFDGMLISGDVRLVKPDHAIFELLLQRMGRPAEECLFIDDLHANIRAADELGFQTIHFQSAAQLEDELQRRGLLKN